jgi:hypothetical protein
LVRSHTEDAGLERPRDLEKRLHLGRETARVVQSQELVQRRGPIGTEPRPGGGGVRLGAEAAAVQVRGPGGDGLAFAGFEARGLAQDGLGEAQQMLGSVRPERKWATDPGNVCRQRDMGHATIVDRR